MQASQGTKILMMLIFTVYGKVPGDLSYIHECALPLMYDILKERNLSTVGETIVCNLILINNDYRHSLF